MTGSRRARSALLCGADYIGHAGQRPDRAAAGRARRCRAPAARRAAQRGPGDRRAAGPADGQPILLLADHPATGGYPVIAVVAHRRHRPGRAAAARRSRLRFTSAADHARADHARSGSCRRSRPRPRPWSGPRRSRSSPSWAIRTSLDRAGALEQRPREPAVAELVDLALARRPAEDLVEHRQRVGVEAVPRLLRDHLGDAGQLLPASSSGTQIRALNLEPGPGCCAGTCPCPAV